MKNIFSKASAEKRTQNGVKSYLSPTFVLSPILIFAFLTLGVGQAWAEHGYNGQSFVYLNTNNGTTYYYQVSDKEWDVSASLPDSWGGVLKDQTINNVQYLQLKGGAVGGWTGYGDVLSGTLHYKITNNTTLPSSGWIELGSINYSSVYQNNSNHCYYYNNGYSTDITPHTPGTYYLHIKITDGDSNDRTSYAKIVVPPYTVAGSASVLGSDWNVRDSNNDMTFSTGTSYTLTKTNVSLSTGENYECKVAVNHDWSESYPVSNKQFTVDANGHYNVTFTFNAVSKDVSVTTTRLYTITPVAKYTDDGSAYTESTTGGTVTINGNSSATQVIEDATYEIVATPASGYCVEEIKVGDAVAWSQPNDDSRQTEAKTISTYTATTNANVTVKFAKLQDITVYIYVGGCTNAQINSVEMNGCKPYVGTTQLTAIDIKGYNSGSTNKFTKNGDWLEYTFSNVTKVSDITCARSGGNIFTGEITDNIYYKFDGTKLDGKCVARTTPTWNVAPADGTAGGSMTATINNVPDGATVEWSSSDENTASVNSSGLISYKAPGPATISARIQKKADGDYCALDETIFQDITVTSGATVTATRICPEYVSSHPGQVKLDISSTGASTGWYYRVCNSAKTAYYAPDEQSAANNTLSWTMNGALPTGSNTLVVELYNSALQYVCTSNPVTVNVEIAESVTISAGANGSVSPSGTVYANSNNLHPTITATPYEHYHFVNWTSNNAAASVADANSATTTVTATASGYTITANFAGDKYTITYKDQGGVDYSGNNEGSLPATHTYGTATDLVNGTKEGFTFGGWYTNSECTVSAGSSIGATAKTSNFTLYAKWTEKMSALSTSNHYNVGNPGYAAPTVSNSATNVGYETTRTITATAVGTGYRFVGWTLTNCTRTDGGEATANQITIRSNGDGAAASVVANYEEYLSTEWKIIGQSPSDKANSPFSSWTYASSTNTMAKATGHSTESVAYATISVPAASVTGEYYEFKISNGTTHYGYGTNEGYYILFDKTKTDQSVYSNNNHDHALRFKPNVAGDYTFKIDYSNNTKKVSVTFPVSYTVTYGVGTGYTPMGRVSTEPSISSGDYVIAGTNITFTATPNLGYKFVGWYNNAECTGDAISTNATYNIASLNANTTLYAKFDYRPLYIHADFAPNGWDTPVQMTQSTENRAVYTYEIDPLAAKSGTPADYGHHFHFVNTVENPNGNKAYNYKGVQTPTGSGFLTNENIHLTHEDNATIQFDLMRKSKITITLTLQSIDDNPKPTVNIAADPYYTVSTAKGSHDVGITTISPASVEARSGANSAAITATIAPGYTFVNWTPAGPIIINSPNDPTTTVQATGDGTLIANATPNHYAVHFDGNSNNIGGSMSDMPALTYGVAFKLTANAFTKTGYTFAGWALSADGEVVYRDEEEVSNLTPVNNGTATLYAKWTPNQYTVTLDKQTSEEGYGGNEGTVTNQMVTFDATLTTVSGSMPTAKNGWAFMGFYSATGGNGRCFIDPSGNWVTNAGDTIRDSQ